MYASYCGHKEIVRLLLQHGNIDINQQDERLGQTALMVAFERGHEEIVKMLKAKGEETHATN